MIPTPPIMTATHEVLNQAHALENYNAYLNNLPLQEAVKTGTPGDPGRARTLALQIAGELGAHIDKENNVLYPMAERMLGAGQLAALEASFAEATR